MHIGFRTSGGRGEYELVGGHAGQSAAGLEGWTFNFRWPDGVVRDTLLWLDPGESGKPRLRSLATPPFQVGRLVAAVLLLPPPRRDMRNVASTLPVLQANEYVVSKIGFGPATEFASPPEAVTAEPNYVEIANSAHSDFVNVSSRWLRLVNIWDRSNLYPLDVAVAINRHRAYQLSGIPVNAELARIADDLRVALQSADPAYEAARDPLPSLERLAGILPLDEPSLPPPDELSEDEIDVKARSAQIYRLARVRGSTARRFSVEVRKAYRERCAFCGARLGGVQGIPSGIDAAHILAWGSYDLDVVSNGIALCKNHHWAFDVALMVPVIQHDLLVVRFTNLKQHFESDALAILGSDGFTIPEEWMPIDPTQRPSAKYLARLYDDLAITF